MSKLSLASPQLVGRLCWSLAQDASLIITPRVVYLLVIIEWLVSIFYSIAMSQRLIAQISESQKDSSGKDKDSLTFSLNFVSSIQSIGSQISQQEDIKDVIIVSAIILGLLCIVFMLLFVYLIRLRTLISESKSKINSGMTCLNFFFSSQQKQREESEENLDERGGLRYMGAFLVIFSSTIYQPLLAITVNMVSYSQKHLHESTLCSGVLVINILSTLMIIVLFFISRKFIKINSPSCHLKESKLTRIGHHVSLACWSEPDSNIKYLGLLSRILTVILLSLDLGDGYVLVEIIGIVIIQGLNLIGSFILQFRSMHFNSLIRAINLIGMFSVTFISVQSLIRQILSLNDHREGILLPLILIFLIVCLVKSQRWYSQYLLAKYLDNIKPTSTQLTIKEKQVKELTALQRIARNLKPNAHKTVKASQDKSSDIDLQNDHSKSQSHSFNFKQSFGQRTKQQIKGENHNLKEAEMESLFIILLDNMISCLNKFHKASFSTQINIFDWDELSCLISLVEVHQATCEHLDCPCSFFGNFVDSFHASNCLGVEQIKLCSGKYSSVFKFLTSQQRGTQFKSNLSKLINGIDSMRESDHQVEDHPLSMSFNGKLYDRKESSLTQMKIGSQKHFNEVTGEKAFIISQEFAFTRFIVDFTNIFLKDLRNKAPESEFIENCYNYFHIFLNERPHLALVSLLQEGGRILKAQNKSWT